MRNESVLPYAYVYNISISRERRLEGLLRI